MKHHWSSWLIAGGLALDLIDAVTSKAGSAGGGMIYGTAGFLTSVDSQIMGFLPGVHTGTLLAMVGVTVHLMQGKPA